ncbi:hypothetical protein C8F01DRAFT_1237247 [Mycena amicta]|nr:hypothetical protein C8F01DRAFT_1237247 [Mycena amicta]
MYNTSRYKLLLQLIKVQDNSVRLWLALLADKLSSAARLHLNSARNSAAFRRTAAAAAHDDDFVIPAENATSGELRTALKQAQLTIGRLATEVKELTLLNAALAGKKKNKKVTVDVHGYLDVIKNLGKKYGVMNDLFVHHGYFTARPATGAPPHSTQKDVQRLFSDQQLFTQYSTMELYEYIPSKFHDIVDTTLVPDFAYQFLHYAGAERATAFGNVKAILPGILKDLKITRSYQELLYHPRERTDLPPSGYPPILYRHLESNIAEMYRGQVLPLVLRGILFGKTSAKECGKAEPAKGSVGYIWQLNTVSIPSICFTIVAVMFALSNSDQSWAAVGKTSKIPYRDIYRKHQELLMSNLDGVRRTILPHWNHIVFFDVNIVQAIASADGNIRLDEDIAGGFAEAMANLDVDDNMNHSYEGFDDIWNGNPASSVNNDSDNEDIVNPPVGFEEEQVEDEEEQIEDEDEIDAPIAKRARPRRVEFVVSDSEPDDDIVQARPQGKGKFHSSNPLSASVNPQRRSGQHPRRLRVRSRQQHRAIKTHRAIFPTFQTKFRKKLLPRKQQDGAQGCLGARAVAVSVVVLVGDKLPWWNLWRSLLRQRDPGRQRCSQGRLGVEQLDKGNGAQHGQDITH